MAAVFEKLKEWPNESIYDGNRLALPDEVVNFQRGDGIEKAITLMNIAKSRYLPFSVKQTRETILVLIEHGKFGFVCEKNLNLPAM